MSQRAQTPNRITNVRQTLKRLIALFREHKVKVILAGALIALGSVGGVLGNSFLKPVFNNLATGGSMGEILKTLVIMGAVVLLSASFEYLGNRFIVHIGQSIIYRLRRDLFDRLQRLPISFFDTHQHGVLMSTFTNDMDTLDQFLGDTISNLVTSVLTFVGAMTMMILLSPQLTIIAVVMVIAIFFFTRLIGSQSSRYFRERQKATAAMNGYIEEMMAGQKVIKVFNHEDAAQEDFAVFNDELERTGTIANTLSIIMMPLMGNLSYIHYAVTAIIGIYMIITGRGGMDIGTLVAFLQYTRSFARPIVQAANQFNIVVSALAGAERIFMLIDQPVEADEGRVTLTRSTEDGACQWAVPQTDGSIMHVPVCGHIEFDDVSFGYVPDKTVLRHVALCETRAEDRFVGSTGAGKRQRPI